LAPLERVRDAASRYLNLLRYLNVLRYLNLLRYLNRYVTLA
jgi:hypothetical protein